MKILLSDGSGLTARQVAGRLAESGHDVEVLSPDRLCLCRFTRHVRRVHQVPRYGADPLGWLDAALAVNRQGKFDLLFPTQEQVAVLSHAAGRLALDGVRTVVPPFEALRAVQDKVSASATLGALGIPQPTTAFVASADELRAWRSVPVFIKTPIGTATSGVRLVDSLAALRSYADELEAAGVFAGTAVAAAAASGSAAVDGGATRSEPDGGGAAEDAALDRGASGSATDEGDASGSAAAPSAAAPTAAPAGRPALGVIVQEPAAGPLVMVQAVFARGELVAAHANLRVREGSNGGASHKRSLDKPAVVVGHLESLGRSLRWHGGLSADAILTDAGPVLIDINPRLVEPVNAWRSGVDLVGAMLDVAVGDVPQAQPPGRPGVATHQLLLAALGAAARNRARRAVVTEIWAALTHTGLYRGSAEELTPVRGDLRAALPVIAATATVLVRPAAGRSLAAGGVADYALTPAGWGTLLSTPPGSGAPAGAPDV